MRLFMSFKLIQFLWRMHDLPSRLCHMFWFGIQSVFQLLIKLASIDQRPMLAYVLKITILRSDFEYVSEL